MPAYFNESEGFYDPVSHEIVFSAEQDNDKTVFHEFLHASTRGNTDISENAKKELREGYKKQGSSLVMMKEKKDEYFSDPTEILVRKQILDKELEQLGVKKYGEEFTDEHYKRTMELYQRGRFSDNASDFIERTKSENFKKIMNEIAKNENTENFESNQA